MKYELDLQLFADIQSTSKSIVLTSEQTTTTIYTPTTWTSGSETIGSATSELTYTPTQAVVGYGSIKANYSESTSSTYTPYTTTEVLPEAPTYTLEPLTETGDYKVILYPNNGEDETVELATYTTTVNREYTFEGYYTSQTGGTLVGMPGDAISFDPLLIAGLDTFNIYAHWGDLIATESTTIIPIVLPTVTYAGYTFAGWYDSSTGEKVGDGGDEYTPTAETILEARWSTDKTIYYKDSSGAIKQVSKGYVMIDGAIVEKTVPELYDYLNSLEYYKEK